MMAWLNNKWVTLVLWVLVVISAAAVVYSNHISRQSFIEWQSLLKESQNIDVEWGQLLLEQSALSSYARLEYKASEELNMEAPRTEEIVVLQGGRQ